MHKRQKHGRDGNQCQREKRRYGPDQSIMMNARQQGCIECDTATAGQCCKDLIRTHVTPTKIFRACMQPQPGQQRHQQLMHWSDKSGGNRMADHKDPGKTDTQRTNPDHPVGFECRHATGYQSTRPIHGNGNCCVFLDQLPRCLCVCRFRHRTCGLPHVPDIRRRIRGGRRHRIR